MGINMKGGMIVGNHASGFEYPDEYESFNEFCEYNHLDTMSECYDAGQDGQYFGFRVIDIPVNEIYEDGGWLNDVRDKAKKFEKLTGLKAELIGTQDVW